MPMPVEHELGTLIRRMNPYTSGRQGTMDLGLVGLSSLVTPGVAAARAAANAAAAAAAAGAAHARFAAAAAQAAGNGAAPDAVAVARAVADAAAAAAAIARIAANAAETAYNGAAPDGALEQVQRALQAAEAADAAARGARDAHDAAGARADADNAIARAEEAVNAAERAANAADQIIDLAHIDLVIDDFIANYSSADWVFRGQPQTVKRAIRITYRYQARDTQQNPIPGVYATEHILVGYAGGNGSA